MGRSASTFCRNVIAGFAWAKGESHCRCRALIRPSPASDGTMLQATTAQRAHEIDRGCAWRTRRARAGSDLDRRPGGGPPADSHWREPTPRGVSAAACRNSNASWCLRNRATRSATSCRQRPARARPGRPAVRHAGRRRACPAKRNDAVDQVCRARRRGPCSHPPRSARTVKSVSDRLGSVGDQATSARDRRAIPPAPHR